MYPLSRIRCRWIVSAKYDLFFFIGSVGFTFLFLAVYKLLNSMFNQGQHTLEHAFLLFIIFTALFDHPHIFQTFSRTHYDKREFSRHKFIYTGGIVLFVVAGWAILATNVWAQWAELFAFVGFLHIMWQNKGFLSAYKNMNKDFHPLDNFLDKWGYYAMFFLTGFWYYTPEGGRALFGLIPPLIFFNSAKVLFWVFVAVYFARQAYMLLYSVLNLPKVLLVVATVGTSYLINLDPFMPLLMLLVLDSIYHDVQYQGWMAHYQKKFFPNVKNVAGKWLAASIVYGIIAGVLEYYSFSGGFFAYLFVPFSMLVAYHYYVDGLIWKFRKDHRLRKTLLD